MKVVALISGGKDSCYAMHLAQRDGHEIVALGNLLPSSQDPDELDSYMFQTVGHQLLGMYASCMGVPMFRRHLRGRSAHQALTYTQTEGDEVEDLYALLAYVKEIIPSVTAVTTGAIASDYQRLRVEHVCSRLGLVSLAPLWHQPQRQLLRGMVEAGLEAILVKVAALGLDPHKHLGKTIAQVEPLMQKLNKLYGSNVCGEGGEYETLTLDCPVFTRARIVLDQTEVVIHSADALTPVGYLRPTSFHLEYKRGSSDAAGRSQRPSGSGAAPAPADQPHVHQPHGKVEDQVIQVPDNYTPAKPVTAPSSNSHRLSLDGTHHSMFNIHMRGSWSGNFIQLCCWAVTKGLAARSPEYTESDTAGALQEIITAITSKLAEHGLTLDYALNAQLFLANMGHFAAVNSVYCKHFPAVSPPSRTCVQLPLGPRVPVMLGLLLARDSLLPGSPSGPGGQQHVRRTLHVQSISAWAPSCIGPYSQAVAHRGLVYMAGSIPLQPSSMAVVSGDAGAQALRALANAQAVAVAMKACCLKAAVGMVVYWASVAGQAGKAQIMAAVQQSLDHGLPPAHKLDRLCNNLSALHVGCQPGGGDSAAEPERGTNGRSSHTGARQDSEEEGEEEEDEATSPVDPYLEEPRPHRSVRCSIVYVEVPALPRGCLVEVQPLLLDLTWLEARRQSAAESSSSSSGSEAGDQGGPQELDPQRSEVQGQGQSQPPAHRAGSSPRTGPGGRLRSHLLRGHTRTLTPDSCQASISTSASIEDAGELGQQGNTGGSGGGGGGGGEDVMVTTIDCAQDGIISSLFHLPASVLQGSQVNQRLSAAVRAFIASNPAWSRMAVVHARAWVDTHQVPGTLIEQLHLEGSQEQEAGGQDSVHGLHIQWAPALSVDVVTPGSQAGSTPSSTAPAAVLEVVLTCS